MRHLFLLLFMIPVFGFSQTSFVYVKLTDAKGNPINGDATTRGFEKAIQALSTASSGKNNVQFSFTMPVTGAGALLKSAMASGEQLLNGTVYVMATNRMTGTLQTTYTITMEKIRVNACAESMGCNSVMTTSVTLQAGRIGWTYYQTDRSGAVSVSQKYGWNADTGQPWTQF